ncbi:MAG: LytTR family DNA-binding domain-containing protein [Lachnospiraceae bacterium]
MIAKREEMVKQITQVVICEKNTWLLNMHQSFLEYIAHENNIELEIRTFASPNAMLFAISYRDMYDCDMILINTQLQEVDGFEVAKEFRKKGYEGEIVYLTEEPERVLDSFDVGAFHYMLYRKFSFYEFEQLMVNCLRKIKEKKESAFVYRGVFGMRYIQYNEIWYLKVQDKKVGVFGKNGRLVDSFSGTLSELEDELGGRGLVRVHRSYIINIRYLKKIGKEEAILGEEVHIPIGIRYQKLLTEFLAEYADVPLL